MTPPPTSNIDEYISHSGIDAPVSEPDPAETVAAHLPLFRLKRRT